MDFVTKDSLVEAKYKQELLDKQQELLPKSKLKKEIAIDLDFFL